MNDTVHIDRSMEFTVSADPERRHNPKHIGMFEIYVTRCDLVRELKHAEIDPKLAGRLFVQELTEALLPASQEGKHNRMVHFVVRMYDGAARDTLTLTNTGPFPCVHLTTGKELAAYERKEETDDSNG